ncbi:ABC transporter ATP-binding protein [Vallitalea pronyensis]|uniref:ABC transporter ATP-binding protein n=1 Tax=Vallitalea pronyensis TaxID=1348613 RepID=A0A8J8MN15_9FIRM|nr:ABC transporter ATP-binding protein [Vallitalea pronyensis]QUI24541.1 ABC transporter ATP-binding protein [Vallitalea pronyensis]
MKKILKQYNDIILFFAHMIPDKKRHVIIAFFAGLSDSFFNLLLAFILKNVYASVTERNIVSLNRTILFFILFIAGIFLYNYVCWCLHGSSVAKISGTIKGFILSKLCLLRLSSIENHHSGDIISILTSDVNHSQFLYANIRLILSSLLMGIISTVLVFNTSLFLGVMIGILACIQLLINLFVVKPLQKQSSTIRENTKQMTMTFSDILENNMSIRIYCSQNFYMKISSQMSQRLYQSKIKLHRINAVILGINVCFGLLGYILVLILGSLLISANKLTIPDLLFVTQMRLMMVQGILKLGHYTVHMQPAITGMKKIMSFMDEAIEENI